MNKYLLLLNVRQSGNPDIQFRPYTHVEYCSVLDPDEMNKLVKLDSIKIPFFKLDWSYINQEKYEHFKEIKMNSNDIHSAWFTGTSDKPMLTRENILASFKK